MIPALRVEGLGKSFHINAPGSGGGRVEHKSLDDVHFQVEQGEVFGIIGRNGAGKSTLLKILSRIVVPTSGRALVRGRVASLLEVGTGMHPELTGRENIFLNGAILGMKRSEVASRLNDIVEFADIGDYLDTPIKRYSSGMGLRLAFAVAANLVADVMLVDEVLAVGDAEFQARCMGRLRDGMRSGRTTLFVSHNMAAVSHLCGRVLWLDGGKVRACGPAAEVIRAYLSGVAGSGGVQSDLANRPGAKDAVVSFLRAEVSAPGGGAPIQGDDILVRCDVRVRIPVRGLQVRVGIETLEGERVLDLCNGDTREEWNVAAGDHRVEVHLRGPRLLPREYSLRLVAQEAWGRPRHDEVERAALFSVQGIDVLGHGVMLKADRGVTWAPAAFRMIPHPHQES